MDVDGTVSIDGHSEYYSDIAQVNIEFEDRPSHACRHCERPMSDATSGMVDCDDDSAPSVICPDNQVACPNGECIVGKVYDSASESDPEALKYPDCPVCSGTECGPHERVPVALSWVRGASLSIDEQSDEIAVTIHGYGTLRVFRTSDGDIRMEMPYPGQPLRERPVTELGPGVLLVGDPYTGST